MEITANFGNTKPIDIQIVREVIYSRIIELWRNCVREFVKVAVESLQADIDTGMSMASMLPLATNVKLQSLIEANIHGRGIHKKAYHAGGQYAGSGDKSAEHGAELGQKAYDIEFGTPTSGKLLFRFKIVVLQYFLHEQGLAKRNSHNWQSLTKGATAFVNYWETQQDKYLTPELLETILNGELPPVQVRTYLNEY